jgi:DNA-binding transcriptional MerR regulator
MGLKISAIAKQSGVPASTIRYYVKEGLLPEPERKNKSMSYYDEACVEKLRSIRQLQERRYYPLSVIRNILKRMDEGLKLEEAEAIEHVIFGTQTDCPIDLRGFLEKTGLSKEDVRTAEACGLLMPYIQEGSRKLYDHEDIRFAQEVFKPIKDQGGDIKVLDFYVDLGRQILEKEMKLRRLAVKGKSKQENIRLTTQISTMAEFMRGYVLKRLFQRMVQATIQKSLDHSSR